MGHVSDNGKRKGKKEKNLKGYVLIFFCNLICPSFQKSIVLAFKSFKSNS